MYNIYKYHSVAVSTVKQNTTFAQCIPSQGRYEKSPFHIDCFILYATL